MKKKLLLFYLSVLLSIGAGVAKAKWDNNTSTISTNVEIGNINTIEYNVSRTSSVIDDINELGLITSNSIDFIGAFLLKNENQYDLILYFNGLFVYDYDVFDITINNYPYSLEYISNFNSALFSKGHYYVCEFDYENRYKKIYIQNVGNIDFVKVNSINYYYWENVDEEDSLLCDDIIDLNKTMNVIKGF